MAESVQFQNYTPLNPWFDQADVPLEFRQLTPEQQAQRLAGIASFTIETTAQVEAREALDEQWRAYSLSYLGDKALNGANNIAFQAGVEAENVMRELFGGAR
ncbi:MAG: hypothetical protein JWP13_198 [Candidatus Saccharibacteria bacterium]|nr:hypothetical protein [Candidatus Saccharibacteria bacterium]